jgi:hypothetical protein
VGGGGGVKKEIGWMEEGEQVEWSRRVGDGRRRVDGGRRGVGGVEKEKGGGGEGEWMEGSGRADKGRRMEKENVWRKTEKSGDEKEIGWRGAVEWVDDEG